MRVLFVKLTSMGDLIHALPALTDAARAIPGITFDWVIDNNFKEVAMWHPSVRNIIPTAHRKWRKNIWKFIKNGEIKQFLQTLRREKYDLVIDGQTSLKSFITMLLTRGTRCGPDKYSTREWIAHLAYQKTFPIDRNLHAIKRLRLLFAKALNYEYLDNQPDYGLANYTFPELTIELPQSYVVFVHNASWQTKLYPEAYWQQLTGWANDQGLHVLLPWGNEAERQRAEKIARPFSKAKVLPFLSLSEQAAILKGSVGAICSDTGLSHLAAALDVPAVTIYGSTSTQLTGTTGLNQQHAVSPFSCTLCYKQTCDFENKRHSDAQCMLAIKPEQIWSMFNQTATIKEAKSEFKL